MRTTKKFKEKRNTKDIAFRDMIEHLHCFVEEMNMTQAQDPEKSHSDKLRATRTITADRASHVFVNKDYVVIFAIHRNPRN